MQCVTVDAETKAKACCLWFQCQGCFVQTDWPGEMNDLSCFRETKIYSLLLSKQLPDWMHIISDEAYSPLSVKCNHQILTPFSQNQLNTAKKEDWRNLQDWQDRATENPGLNIEKPILVTGRWGVSTTSLAVRGLQLSKYSACKYEHSEFCGSQLSIISIMCQPYFVYCASYIIFAWIAGCWITQWMPILAGTYVPNLYHLVMIIIYGALLM